MKKQGICILGATGSIGQNTLDVIAHNQGLFDVIALCAHQSFQVLFEQCLKFEPAFAVLSDQEAAQKLQSLISGTSLKTQVLAGEEALCEVVSLVSVDKVMSAIVGAKGLMPTLKAIQAGKVVLIANKEPLVMAGALMMHAAEEYGATIIPVDSEHNAIFQCLPDNYRVGQTLPKTVRKLTLTASGGPFLHYPQEAFADITPSMASQHPNWKMGQKITVDCATLMNKGLEVIEASHLFAVKHDCIDVVVHPESLIHALVSYCDGSLLAHMGAHDMRIAISHSMAWPHRIASQAPFLDLIEVAKLNFFAPDTSKFPCLRLAYDAMRAGKAAPTVLNASNEVVVHAFLQGQVRFNAIPVIIEKIMNKLFDLSVDTIEQVLQVDSIARNETLKEIRKF